MKYIVYQTINLVNNKIYIGVHKTENPEVFDGYLGCGVSLQKPFYKDHPYTPFHCALKKYGFSSFHRITLKEFDSLEEALELEAQLVTLEFTKRADTYNIAVGGRYGGKAYFPIYQFDRTGKLIQQWDNQHLAAEALGTYPPAINRAISTKGSCYGYLWSKEPVIDISEFSWHVGEPVYQYDNTGELIKVFESITEVEKTTGYKCSAISRAIHMQVTHQGFYWSNTLYDKFIPSKVSIEGKTLYIYDLDGNFLTELKSGKEIAKYYGRKYGCSAKFNIKEALISNRPFKGTQISLERLDHMPKSTYVNVMHPKRVGRFSEDGILLEEFESINQARKIYGSSVSRALSHKQNKAAGYIFRFLD